MKRLLIYQPSFERLRGELASIDGVTPVVAAVGDAAPETRIDCAWTNADVFFSDDAPAFMRAVLKAPDLRWVQTGSAGVEHPVFAAIVGKGATLTTTHVQASGIADLVLWGVLDHWQGGPARRQAQAAQLWDKRPFREAEDSRWLLVGFGAIGQAVAQRARAFGAHVTGARRSGAAHPLADVMVADWLETLPEADVVVLSPPLTAATRRMADADAFGRMKPDAVFVNVGRGGLADEAALLAALDRGRPAHAVLDVFDTEPLPQESRLWRHPRVTVTAHVAGMGSGVQARADAVFLTNLRRYAAGEPPQNVADPRDVLG